MADKSEKRSPLETAGGAYVGYRRAGRRPESQQDRQASANIPVALARGFVSGTLGLPADLLNLPGAIYSGITGKESYELPFGSEYIEKRLPFRGASQTPVGELFTGAGQLAGGAYTGPLSGARAVMAVPKAVMRAGKDFVQSAGQTVSPITVYHGSPHKFDRFDASKIGTGEGAQAYGHGLYLAESPEVAKGYQSRLSSDRGFSYKGKTGLTRAEVQDLVNAEFGGGYLDGVTRPSGVADSIIDDMVLGTQRKTGQLPRQYKEGSERAELYKRLKNEIHHADPGSLYTVDLPDEKIARMLDFDKPLSEQSDFVKSAIKNNELDYVPERLTGGRLLEEMNKAFEPGMVSKHLRDAGIPGIRYLDEQSRGATGKGKWKITMKNGEQKIYDFKPNDDVLEQMGATAEPFGTSNFVVFPGEEDALTILERKKEGGEVKMAEGGKVDNKAAFGVFPQMKPRRSRQDRDAAARIPVDLARGVVSGVLGAPGDIESLVRMLPGFDEKTLLPTSEDIEKRLPFRSETPTARAASGLGQIAGGFYTGPGAPLRLAGALPGAVARAGRDFVQAAGQPAVNVIKPAGGNWLTGSVERAMEPLKRYDLPDLFPELGSPPPNSVANKALNQWIDRNLTNYVKKQMATPDDPVRKLAEEGVVHIPSEQVGINRYRAPEVRRHYGTEQLGKSEAARAWEDSSDVAFSGIKIKDLSDDFREPWMANADPNTMVYGPIQRNPIGLGEVLGFDHIVDVLKQDLDAGRIRPEQLNKVSMEQAVRRTAEFDQEMAKRMREAQIKATEGMPVYREYPEGYRWVELTQPKELPAGMKETVDKRYLRNEAGELVEDPRYKALEDALKYEGDTMGHCVGGYCPDVAQGRSRIYSLRDAKGEPHVTVEVRPTEDKIRDTIEPAYSTSGEKGFKTPDNEFFFNLDEAIQHEMQFAKNDPKMASEIIQIKGKQNKAPKEEYLPFVQDFVRGGKWSEVGDIKNTGLYRKSDFIDEFKPEQLDAIGQGEYLTFDEIKKLREGKPWKPIDTRPELDINIDDLGMKRGGSVSISDNPDAQMMDVMDKKLAVGGILKLGKKAKPAAKAEPSLPLELPRAPAKTREEIRPTAQRMAEQMTGEFVRPNPKKSINPAGKSRVQFEMERGLTHDIRPTPGKALLPQQVADIEKQQGMLKIGVSGDTTIADKTLYRAGPYELDLPSPQHGGPLYALGGEGAWASNNPVAATFQKRVQELSQANKEAPVLGQFLAMGPQGSNFAMHFADANLRAIDPKKMSKQQIEQFNKLIREGSEKSGPRPGFPGIEDKESAYLHFAFDPELRKHFNAMMQLPKYTSNLGLPDGRVILHAITEPELRNTEVLTSGLSQMRLDPSVNPADLMLSAHPTYSHVIPRVPGSDISRTRYPVPAELEFPDVAEFIKKNYRPQDATRVYQTATPRQMVDPQHIDEMKMYEELMKEYTGKKKGGAISKAAQIDGNEFVLAAQKYGLSDDMNTLNKLVSLVNQGATVDEAARIVSQAAEVKMQAGGLAKLAKSLKAAPKKIEAPAVVIPGNISSLKEAVRESKGAYGAKRVERAADEVKNLERMYKEPALKEAFLGDNAKALVTMNPADFEKYAIALTGRTRADIGPKMAELAKQGEIDKYTIPTDEYIQYLMGLRGGFDQVPYLNLFKDEVGLPIKPEVRGHEGRHRSRALAKQGEESSLVKIDPRGDLREGLPRRSQEEYIEALREELERSGRLVLPEVDGPYRRPAIKLPEPYATGGAVKMVDDGLIKVTKKRKAKA